MGRDGRVADQDGTVFVETAIEKPQPPTETVSEPPLHPIADDHPLPEPLSQLRVLFLQLNRPRHLHLPLPAPNHLPPPSPAQLQVLAHPHLTPISKHNHHQLHHPLPAHFRPGQKPHPRPPVHDHHHLRVHQNHGAYLWVPRQLPPTVQGAKIQPTNRLDPWSLRKTHRQKSQRFSLLICRDRNSRGSVDSAFAEKR